MSKNYMLSSLRSRLIGEAELRLAVKTHWEQEACGIRYGTATDRKEWITEIEQARHELAPYIPEFADFKNARGKKVLEIGVGAGVDFCNWVKNGAHAYGIDLTEEAISLTRERLKEHNLHTVDLRLADAENLPFQDREFDLVYSWGVLHHSPDTAKAFREAYRVLKDGGTLKAMIYRVPSMTGFLLWIRYCLFTGKIWQSPRRAIFKHLESPGTKAYTLGEARTLLEGIGFKEITLRPQLCAGDLLLIKPSKKYQSPLYKLLWKLYPRWFIKLFGNRFGLELLIQAKK